MSSSNPAGTVKLGAALEQSGIGLVDAPVSGGIARAVTGTLALMAGTNDAEYLEQRARPCSRRSARRSSRPARSAPAMR